MKIFFQIILTGSLLFIIPGCSSIFETEPENNSEAIFEEFWNTFDESYAVFDERGVDWDDQYAGFRPSVNAGTSDDELFAILSQMVEPLDDGHVTVTAPDRQVFFGNRIRSQKIDDELFDRDVIKGNYLEPGYAVGEEDSYIYENQE